MPKAPRYLLIGSTETYSGKSATILGLFHRLQQKGLDLTYGKPLGNYLGSEGDSAIAEADVQFLMQLLNLSPQRLLPTILALDETTIGKRLRGEDKTDYRQMLKQYLKMPIGDLALLEGPGTLEEGSLFDLRLLQVAEVVNASILLVARYKSVFSVEPLISARRRLGDRLIGVLLNDIPADQLETVNNEIRPYLEQRSIRVFGMLPRSDLLRSVSVEELVNQLQAEVLCRPDRLDLMVESLAIGAMNVNSALRYFNKRRNMAVVTGGDRKEIQLAALESSTQCLILTGKLPPSRFIISKAEELEIPILSVDLDTLTTVEIVNRAFGQVRLHEPIKVEYIRQLMTEHFDIDRLLSQLGVSPAVALP